MPLKRRRWARRLYRSQKLDYFMEAYSRKIQNSGSKSIHWRENLRGVIYPVARLKGKIGKLGRLGIDCCAVCSRKHKLKSCCNCKRIKYCSRLCARVDAAAHFWSCKQLQSMSTCNSELAAPVESTILTEATDLRKKNISSSWVAELIREAPQTRNLSREQFSTISYALSLAWLCTKLKTRGILPATPQSILLVGAGAKEAAVPARVWADAWRLLGPDASTMSITLLGPELNRQKKERIKLFYDRNRSLRLTLNFIQRNYEPSDALAAQFVVCFNPGFNCPDYNWNQFTRLSIAENSSSNVPPVIALFGHTIAELKVDLLSLTEEHQGEEQGTINDDNGKMPVAAEHQPVFLSKNPFHCPCWRQSDTLANDLYRKHTACLVLSK
mmetsp:Transcript_13938/g.20939  ORF Transcript_13938/g.20939 Transcript_13938/m.20939 type:complete len:384 (+) Transcript_13938:100-1251(+)